MDIKKRRQFTVEQKVEVLTEIDRFTSRSEVSEYLKENRLFSSQVSRWRKAHREGTLNDAKRGRKSLLVSGDSALVAAKIQRKEELRRKISEAEHIMNTQQNLMAILSVAADQKNR